MIQIKDLSNIEYNTVLSQMREFTEKRNSETPDQIWLVEHPPVFTLGLAANPNHILNANGIPIIKTDRGGEVTYHGPGQAVAYVLLNLKRKANQNPIFAKNLVARIEQAIIDTLAENKIFGERKKGAPGIYISPQQNIPELIGAKIAAIGLKITRSGMTYHGFALNVDMNLQPFSYINPCGYANLKVTDMKTLGASKTIKEIQETLAAKLKERLE